MLLGGIVEVFPNLLSGVTNSAISFDWGNVEDLQRKTMIKRKFGDLIGCCGGSGGGGGGGRRKGCSCSCSC